jgi:hypothetical protein
MIESALPDMEEPLLLVGEQPPQPEEAPQAEIEPWEPNGFLIELAYAAIIPVGEASEYLDPTFGSAAYIGYAVPGTRPEFGFTFGLYLGSASGETIDARTTFVPLGLEYRYTIGSGRWTAVPRFAGGAFIISAETIERGTLAKTVPYIEGGLAGHFALLPRLALFLDVSFSTIFEQSIVINAIRPAFGVRGRL